jgi:hypothetical protein
MHVNDGCRPMLPARNSQQAFRVLISQQAFRVLISKLAQRNKGIHDVALRGTTFHGRGSAFGARHWRLVDAARRLFPGRIAGFDGLIVRSRSSSVDEVIRTVREATMVLQNAAIGTSIFAELALVGASAHEMGSVYLQRSHGASSMCSIPIALSCIICADPARDGGRSMALLPATGRPSRFGATNAPAPSALDADQNLAHGGMAVWGRASRRWVAGHSSRGRCSLFLSRVRHRS